MRCFVTIGNIKIKKDWDESSLKVRKGIRQAFPGENF